MKITLIQPYYHNIWEMLGLGYVGAYCKHKIPSLQINSFQAFFDSDEEIIRGAKDSDIVGFSCMTPAFGHGIKLARELKKINPGIRIVFGGFHVTALKEKIVEECVDHIIIGEGEEAFLKIIEGCNDRIVFGTKLQFDQLPWPDRKLIKNNRTIDYCDEHFKMRIASFQANRGCMFRCAICGEKSMTGIYHKENNPIRTRNVDDLLDEIEATRQMYNINYFKFVDATFDVSSEFVIEFCEKKMKRELNIEWECMVHAALAKEEFFRYLKPAACKQINIGCESGSKKILKDMHKGVTPEKLIQVFDWAKKYDVKTRAFFVLGMPNETEEDLTLTDQLIIKLRPDVVGFTLLCPFPGSDLYDHKKMKDVNWATADEYVNDFWKNDHFTNVQLKEIQARFVNKFKKKVCFRQGEIK